MGRMDKLGLWKSSHNPITLPNLSSKVWATGLISFLVIIQIGLENAHEFVTQEELFHLHVAITAGILDNIIPAFIIFWVCLKYIKVPFLTIVAMVWFTVETLDGIARLVLMYSAYFSSDVEFAYYLNENYLIPLYWGYIVIPLLWLGMIHKNFLSRPTATYTPLNTYLLFARPKNVQDILISLTGAPTSHVAVIHKGQYYFFKRGLKGYRKQLVRFSILKQGRLVKIDPPPDFGKMLDCKLGSPYKLISNNCCTVLRGTGIEVGRLDFFPAVFMMRYL